MFEELYHLYLRCFPEYPITLNLFLDLLKPQEAYIIQKREQTQLTGFAMIHANSITLLCVDKPYRGKGIGSKLLKESEAYIAKSGADNIILGRGRHYLLQGVPADKYNHVSFFETRGYTAQWSSVNMSLSLEHFDRQSLRIPPCPEEIHFRFLRPEELPKLLIAVKNAQANWVRIFENCSDPILIAESKGQILGFEILDPNGGRFVPLASDDQPANRVGSVGCVGVIHAAREKGIGLQMVAGGLEWLKRQGCSSVELRYVELVEWYGKLGFEMARHQWMGEKLYR